MAKTPQTFKGTPNLQDQEFLQTTKQLESNIQKYNEQMRLSYSNPFKEQSFSNARMYWSSTGEIWARVLILVALILNIALAALFGQTFLDYIFVQVGLQSVFNNFNLSIRNGATILMALVSIVFATIVYLPMVICSTSGYVHGWAVFHIVMAVGYFIGMELFFALSLALSQTVAIFKSSANLEYALYFIIATLIITIVWMVGSCILIVKSDDIRRRVHVE